MFPRLILLDCVYIDVRLQWNRDNSLSRDLELLQTAS
jgi:hypothetical protein